MSVPVRIVAALATALMFVFATSSASAQLALAGVFGDHMVLQAGRPVPVWGTASPRATVTVRIGLVERQTHAGATGRWGVELPAAPPGGPFELEVTSAGGERVRLVDVLVGEVWLVAGGANMELPVSLAADARATVEAALRPDVRIGRVPSRVAGEPLSDVAVTWTPMLPRTVLDVSAVAYAFACELNDALSVPVGIVQATCPFTRTVAWIPRRGLDLVPTLADVRSRAETLAREHRVALRPALGPLEAWIDDARRAVAEGRDVPPAPPVPRDPLADGDAPCGVWNGMLAPLVPFALRGVLWHLGEQDIGSGAFLAELQRGVVLGWRAAWGRDDLPFFAVQLSPYRYGQHRDTEKPETGTDPMRLPEMWEAQARLLELPDTGLVVTTDLGSPLEFFPLDKAKVARRLAGWALARTYGRKDVVYAGPMLRDVARGGDVDAATGQDAGADGARVGSLVVRLHAAAGLRTSDGGEPTWFELVGDDGVFRAARARIEGQGVRVWSADVARPVGVRFGWHQEAQGNLVNAAGLPAAPFRAALRG